MVNNKNTDEAHESQMYALFLIGIRQQQLLKDLGQTPYEFDSFSKTAKETEILDLQQRLRSLVDNTKEEV